VFFFCTSDSILVLYSTLEWSKLQDVPVTETLTLMDSSKLETIQRKFAPYAIAEMKTY